MWNRRLLRDLAEDAQHALRVGRQVGDEAGRHSDDASNVRLVDEIAQQLEQLVAVAIAQGMSRSSHISSILSLVRKRLMLLRQCDRIWQGGDRDLRHGQVKQDVIFLIGGPGRTL